MTVITVKRVSGLLEVVRAGLPARVQSTGEFEDWNVASRAMLAIASDLLEAVMAEVPPRGRVRAEILSRSLAEYAITFAWLAAAEGDERVLRMRRLVKDEFVEREKAERKLGEQMGRRADYKRLFASDTSREGGPLPYKLLDERTRSRLDVLKADATLKPLPNTFDMAFAADTRWMSEIDLVDRNPFALSYFLGFVGPSFMTHPSVTSIGRVVVGQPPGLVVGLAQPLGLSEAPYSYAFLTTFNMLLVASRALGWPDESALRAVLELA